jgi:folate-dependent phosphoribosylglycinamide formyltransferase PurN
MSMKSMIKVKLFYKQNVSESNDTAETLAAKIRKLEFEYLPKAIEKIIGFSFKHLFFSHIDLLDLV